MRKRIIASLKLQGFVIEDGRIVLPGKLSKKQIRRLHNETVTAKRERAKPGLVRHEERLLRYFASGLDVVPERIRPKLREVCPGTEDELLFRYAALHWSIPVSSSYGRRLRFLVFDEYTDKLMGLFGLGDPVFSLAARDRLVGWNKAEGARDSAA